MNGESFQPNSLKIGPNRNGRQRTATPASPASRAMRMAVTYEYVLANSYQKSILGMMPVPGAAMHLL
ncbi:hypothetical protein AUC70_03030 [Methyloceanibacter stevinii]|uniref:Uncharacterized protein n=1 Tax=Methyloceanibacter stevinii TaxID=1774970 RepID=A0A1E3VQQ8_9HYPH|nr:hypothetical protein AUC70_03030 [Methyloceanibacter stevinii]